ncbi:Nuclear transport factor 2 [Homalodisca vitripennis]|nr:Nuclear transport factor 2 [Homalodisca vitripennis]
MCCADTCKTHQNTFSSREISLIAVKKFGKYYIAETSFMTFEGMQLQGAMKIMEKLNSLTFQKINRIITAVDSQPMFDGGVLINVLGRLQTDEDPPHAYSQTFVLKPIGTSFYVQHDLFRLALHDSL